MIIMEDPYNFCGHRQKTGEKSSIDKERERMVRGFSKLFRQGIGMVVRNLLCC